MENIPIHKILEIIGIMFIILHLFSGLLNFIVWKIKNYQNNVNKGKDTTIKTLYLFIVAVMTGMLEPVRENIYFIYKQIEIKKPQTPEK